MEKDDKMVEINEAEWGSIPIGTNVEIIRKNGKKDIGTIKSHTTIKKSQNGEKLILLTANNSRQLIRHNTISKIFLVNVEIDQEENIPTNLSLEETKQSMEADRWPELQQGARIKYKKKSDGKKVIGTVIYQSIASGERIIGLINSGFSWEVRYSNIDKLWIEETPTNINIDSNNGALADEVSNLKKELENMRSVVAGLIQLVKKLHDI